MISQPETVPAIVTLAAQATGRYERGVVGFRLHRVFDVHAGPYHRHDDLELAGVYEDSKLLKVRILHEEIGGREADDAAKSQTEQKYEHPAPVDVFARPFDAQHLSEYAYVAQPGGSTVRFRALVRDGAHGDGTFTVDPQGNVVSITYSPCVMPPYARSGTIDQKRAEVLPDYWTLTQEVHQYSGRYFIFSGGATVTIDQTRFVRFSDDSSALAALDAGRI